MPRAAKARVDAIRRGRGLEFIGEAIGAHRHGRAALRAHAVQVVLAAYVVGAVGKINPAAIARPGVELVQAVVEGQAA